MDARPASESEIVLRQLMLPEHANPFGNVHGAWVFKLVDEAAGTAAMRHCRSRVVTRLVDQMTFDAPVYVGELVHVRARLTWTGHTSLEVAITVDAEHPSPGLSGGRTPPIWSLWRWTATVFRTRCQYCSSRRQRTRQIGRRPKRAAQSGSRAYEHLGRTFGSPLPPCRSFSRC